MRLGFKQTLSLLTLVCLLIVYAWRYNVLKTWTSHSDDFSPHFPSNYTTEILTKKLPKDLFSKLRQLESEFPSASVEWTQDYANICGRTISNRTRVCAEDLWRIQPDPGDAVPPIVHHILHFSTRIIDFHQAVCMVSAFWMIRPKVMLLWYAHEGPYGEYWNYMVHNLSSHAEQVILMPISKPELIYSQTMKFNQHYADVIRLELLYWHGGVYFDLDVIVLKSFKPLYQYSFTIGRETSTGLCNGILVSSRGNLVVKRWLLLYRFHSHIGGWATMSVTLPHALHIILPQHIHVEEESLDRPNWMNELQWIYKKTRRWNWRVKNYAVHLWYRRGLRLLGIYGTNFSLIQHDDSMYGDMFRFILFGNESLHSS